MVEIVLFGTKVEAEASGVPSGFARGGFDRTNSCAGWGGPFRCLNTCFVGQDKVRHRFLQLLGLA